MTAGGPQSTNLPWIGVIQRVVVPESNARLRAAGSPHSIVWREAYGGSLYKWQNTLEAIEIGLADIGWVGAMWEGSKMPLQNVTYNTPFITDDLGLMLYGQLHRLDAVRRMPHHLVTGKLAQLKRVLQINKIGRQCEIKANVGNSDCTEGKPGDLIMGKKQGEKRLPDYLQQRTETDHQQ